MLKSTITIRKRGLTRYNEKSMVLQYIFITELVYSKDIKLMLFYAALYINIQSEWNFFEKRFCNENK